MAKVLDFNGPDHPAELRRGRGRRIEIVGSVLPREASPERRRLILEAFASILLPEVLAYCEAQAAEDVERKDAAG